jgi:hypothetical protein
MADFLAVHRHPVTRRVRWRVLLVDAAVAAVVAAVLLTRRTIRTAQAQAAELAAHNAELLERADQPAR